MQGLNQLPKKIIDKELIMNVLAIGAHFDDIELGCGGAIAKHIHNNDRVIIQIITHSKYSNHNGDLLREKETALQEGHDAATILGCNEMVCNNFETKKVQFDHILIEAINKVIDENAIDIIYTHWDYDVHQDHQAVGKATLAAGRKISNLLMYQSNLYMNSVNFHKNYFVDISDFIDMKIKAIEAHKTEVMKFGPEWCNFWRAEASNNGQRFGVAYAEAFQCIKYLA